jgi:histidine triad (HIT) family protein
MPARQFTTMAQSEQVAPGPRHDERLHKVSGRAGPSYATLAASTKEGMHDRLRLLPDRQGRPQCHVVCEDDLIIALADIHPIPAGHTQIIPRLHHPYFEDLPAATASRIIHMGQRLSRAMKALYSVPRVAFLFTGGDHAHAHAHIVPMREKTDITSRRYIAEENLTFRSTPRASADELAAAAAKLRAAFDLA